MDDLSDADIAAMLAGGFRAVTTTAPDIPGDADVIVICVPTPLSESDGPDLTAVRPPPKRRRRCCAPGAR